MAPASAAVAAAALPSLLAYNVSPSPTFLNQALAFALWAGFVLLASRGVAVRDVARGPGPLFGALLLLALAAAWALGRGALPASLALSSIGTLLAALVLVAAGAAAASRGDAAQLFAAFCWGWLAAGSLNVAVALIQVFLPDLPDGNLIAHSGLPGRAVGNLRQPNHLSSLLLWSCIAVVALIELGRIGKRTAAALLAALVFAVVLTASRTGLVSVGLLALWAVADRRLSRAARWLLLAAPLVYALAWAGMAQWATLSQHSFGGTQRLAETDISSSRFAIWRDTLALIRAQPWSGVGFGDFNFAWTLTPFPHRPVAFFDHTHNLPLQLAVELGLPLATLVLGLMCWALWRGARNAWTAPSGLDIAQRCAVLMVAMIGLHSLLEYPLWYSYFLLPAAWACGFALQRGATRAATMPPAPQALHPQRRLARRSWALTAAALAVIAGSALAVLDYLRVAAIFVGGDAAPPLEQRIAAGRRSVLFGHHADYAAVTSGLPVADPAAAFSRATHYLLDTRLMVAWANALAARGELDAARHIAARLREFGKDDVADFFASCPYAASAVGATSASAPLDAASTAAQAATPFQCELPVRDPGWQDYRSR